MNGFQSNEPNIVRDFTENSSGRGLDIASKYATDQDLIFAFLNDIPPFFLCEPDIYNVAVLAATIQTRQRRKTGGYSFMRHVLPVAYKAYSLARKRFIGMPDFSPNLCAILGLLHDCIEDSEENGVSPEAVRYNIRLITSPRTLFQVELLTMQEGREIEDKKERDIFQTERWLERIPQMSIEGIIVKLCDINSNTDGKPLRPTKALQREILFSNLEERLISLSENSI